MLKQGLLLLFILGLSHFIQAQKISTFIENQQTVPFQKLYLHTDREFYFEGDTLWFAAYLVQGDSNIPAIESCNLYIDLVDAEGKIIKNELFLIQNGLGQGWLSLSDSTELEGNFLLRAYTDYLKNFGDDVFFTKRIRVSTVKNSFELANQNEFELVTPGSPAQYDTIHQVNPKSPGESQQKEIDVSFLPEGGFLLADESNCVAFKAVDKSGKSTPVSGTLFDEKNNPILTFKSLYKGAGKFYFYPKSGKTYSARINGFPEKEFKLPEAKETGAKIMLVNQGNNQVQVVVQGKNISRGPWYLAGMNRGNGLFYMEIDRKKINSVLKIDLAKFKSGINRLVLLNNNLNPVSERLVFIKNNEINRLQIRLNEDEFSTRENVQLNIKDTTASEISFLSVAVVDENYLNATGVSQNIASYLLLDSELKGHIESPADYFVSEDSLDSQTKLDILMTTNGWSNYIWNDLEKDSLKMKFKPQLGFNFEGHVKHAIGKKALPEGNVSMILFRSDSTKQLLDQPLDANGIFKFQNIVFFDSASVFVQARNKRNNNSVKFEMELPKIIPPLVANQQLYFLHDFSSVPVSVYRQHYLNEMQLKKFYPDRDTKLINEVKVTAEKPKPKFKTGTPMKNNGPYRLTWTMTAGSFDIVEYLANKVPGVHAFRPDSNTLYLKLTPGNFSGIANFFMDGYRYISYDEARSYNINDFKTIEIISPPMSYAYGARAIGGAINLTFKTGEERALDTPLLGGIVERIRGFTSFRQFYSPKYTAENINSKAPDFRNTLYWNPNVILENGQTEAYFFTCDNVSRYKVLVEGISENGNVCLGSADFVVTSFRDSTSDLPTQTEFSLQDSIFQTKQTQTSTQNQSKNKNRQIKKSGTITGTVQNKNGVPIEFATLYNITRKTSCITDSAGFFRLEAGVNDSVLIQQLNYQQEEFVIRKPVENFILTKKDFFIEEVTVSPQFAFDLFNKSCENTWRTFKEENITRAYCQSIRKDGGQISQVADFDLDIVQQKHKKYDRGEKIIPYKIQEKLETKEQYNNKKFQIYLNLFYPLIQQIYWVDLPEHFNYIKKEDAENIQLVLISKSTYDHTCNIEVTIRKKDTLLTSFAMVRKGMKLPLESVTFLDGMKQQESDTIYAEKTYHYIKYDFAEGFGYLSEYAQGAVFSYSDNVSNTYEISEHLKTYNDGTEVLAKRPNRRRIFDNSVNLNSINNRYSEDFWKYTSFPKKIAYDFNQLSRLQVGE